MFQVQGLFEDTLSKDQMLKVYPFSLLACSFEVCWVIPCIQLYFVLLNSAFTDSCVKSSWVGLLSLC